MKKFKILFIFIISGIWAQAQTSLESYEYWFNNAYDNVQTVGVSPVAQHSLSASLDVSALSDGINVLNIRYKDENGFYSSTLSKVFYKNTELFTPDKKLVAYEYWYNNDYTGVQEVAVTPSGQHNLTTAFDVSLLSDGINVLNLRYRDENGIYSSTLSRLFYKNTQMQTPGNQLTGYEYWFNDDHANVQQVSITPAEQYELVAGIDVSGLHDGINILNIRYTDQNGIYSSTLSKAFYKNTSLYTQDNELTAYEFWFNDNYDDVQVVNISPAGQDNLITSIDVSGLNNGINILNIRYRDINGTCSSTLSKSFYKTGEQISSNRIFGYRYWFDDDFENAADITLDPPAEQLILEADIDLTHIPKGEHIINFQFRDSLNVWSAVNTDTVVKLSYPVAAFDYTSLADCDSTVIGFTDLSIDGDEYLWDFGNGDTDTLAGPVYTYYEPGDYTVSMTVTDTLTFADSTVYMDIAVTGKTFSGITVTECDSYTSPGGNYTYNVSGIYSDTIPNHWGCDSIISIDLTINNSVTGSDIITACYSYEWIDGVTYTESNNTATFTLVNSTGCDSVVSLDLTINTVDTSLVANGAVLTAQAGGAGYRWLDCDNSYEPVPGETGQSFTATANGNYAVEITQNECADTSYCYAVTTVSVSDNGQSRIISVYPNPTTGKLYIETMSESPVTEVSIFNIQGVLILKEEYADKNKIELDLDLPDGMYYISINSGGQNAVFKLVKNR